MWRYFALLSLHAPSEQHEYMSCWSAYGSEVHRIEYGEASGTGSSIWDTFRAAWV